MPDRMPAKLTPDEISTVSQLLGKLQPGFLPLPIFLEFTRLAVTVTVELIPIRLYQGRAEVFMVKRPDDDPNWPSAWHFTGTVLRATDVVEGAGADHSRAFKRVIDDEMAGRVGLVGEPTYVTTNFWMVLRGVEYTPVFYVEAADDPADLSGSASDGGHADGGQFFAVDNLPDNIVPHHLTLLPTVVEAFLKTKQ